MFTFLLSKVVVRNLKSTSLFTNTYEQIISYSSISQIRENFIVKDSSLITKKIDIDASITNLLKSYDFTDTQIEKILIKFPFKPSHNPTELIKTKLDFFLSIGFSKFHLAKYISTNSRLLGISLENRLKPNILLLKPFCLTEELLVRALLSSYSLLQDKLETNFFHNVNTLTNLGVPRSNIIKLVIQSPRTLLAPRNKFDKMVELVASMKLNPCSTMFCSRLHVIIGTNVESWKKKKSLYKSLGWSKEDVISAFTRHPSCMLASEEKIKQIMYFFVNIRRCEPSFLAKNPVLFTLNLEKRIMPRCLAVDILVKKQLVKCSYSITQYLISNENFVAKYVRPYQDQVPGVLHAYNGGQIHHTKNASADDEDTAISSSPNHSLTPPDVFLSRNSFAKSFSKNFVVVG